MSKNRLLAILAIGSLFAGHSLSAEPFLRVNFLPEVVQNNYRQEGFESFLIPADSEYGELPTLSYTYENINVAISAATTETPSEFPTKNSKFTTRARSISPEQKACVYHKLYSSWVGAPKFLTVKIAGLQPNQKYKVRFYIFDYSESNASRTGAVIVKEVAPNGQETVPVDYDQTKSPDNKHLEQQSVAIETKAPDNGELIFALRSIDQGNPILNGFDIEIVP